jgi:hypothetical protein
LSTIGLWGCPFDAIADVQIGGQAVMACEGTLSVT